MLATPRFLNLVYHYGTRGATAEQRGELDDLLDTAAAYYAGTIDGTITPDVVAEPGEHVPGTAPAGIKPPEWWRGNEAAFDSSVAAAEQLGEPAARGVTRRPPSIGRRVGV